jgi:hypothetical protein
MIRRMYALVLRGLELNNFFLLVSYAGVPTIRTYAVLPCSVILFNAHLNQISRFGVCTRYSITYHARVLELYNS